MEPLWPWVHHIPCRPPIRTPSLTFLRFDCRNFSIELTCHILVTTFRMFLSKIGTTFLCTVSNVSPPVLSSAISSRSSLGSTYSWHQHILVYLWNTLFVIFPPTSIILNLTPSINFWFHHFSHPLLKGTSRCKIISSQDLWKKALPIYISYSYICLNSDLNLSTCLWKRMFFFIA